MCGRLLFFGTWRENVQHALETSVAGGISPKIQDASPTPKA